MFEEYYQIGNPERDRARGLGLGLAIVRRLAELLDYEIGLDSRSGRGSVFRMRVPRGDAFALVSQRTRNEQGVLTLAGRRVLVIDDDPDVSESMCRAPDTWQCVCIAIASPDEAPDTAPDAMVVDFRLRDSVDGVTTIGRLRRAYGRDVPAIIVSGTSLAEELARLVESRMPLLHKPVPPARLRAALTFVLARSEASELS